jgi:adenosine/AMP kinase
VDRSYDLFEILPDGSPIWKCAVAGHENAVQQLRELARHTGNELRIMHLASNTIIAVLNAPQQAGANPSAQNQPPRGT